MTLGPEAFAGAPAPMELGAIGTIGSGPPAPALGLGGMTASMGEGSPAPNLLPAGAGGLGTLAGAEGPAPMALGALDTGGGAAATLAPAPSPLASEAFALSGVTGADVPRPHDDFVHESAGGMQGQAETAQTPSPMALDRLQAMERGG